MGKKYKTYVTFGIEHVHMINGMIFDNECVALIETDKKSEGREKAFEVFGRKFCFEYPEKHFDMIMMRHFPRGIIRVPDKLEL